MRSLDLSLLLTVFLLASCGQGIPNPLPASSPSPLNPTDTSLPPMPIAVIGPPSQAPALPPPTPTATSPITLPSDRPFLASETGSGQNKILLLADPTHGTTYPYRFPATARFATPFLSGLSPDARYYAYFEGGWLETLYGYEHLRASKPELVLHVLDLRSGEVIFSTPLLSPTFPGDLTQVAETIKDEWWFRNNTFEEVVAATQEFLLDYIRRVAWSPDSSLLAFASQNPGPSSDLFLFNPQSGTAQRVTKDPNHVFLTVWAPDSSALVLRTSLYDRQAREDTTYFFSRDGSFITSFTSQVWSFRYWHDSTYAFLDGATDSGEDFELKAISAADGMTTLLWNGSYDEIVFSPDLSTFLLDSYMPNAPAPPHPGLFLGKREAGSLQGLSEVKGWHVAYWGSEKFTFAASSIERGTNGVTPDGKLVTIDNGYWKLAASPSGSFLAGYSLYRPGYTTGILPGLRIFNGEGQLLESKDDVNVTCVSWNAASTALAYQDENHLYLWNSADGSTRQETDGLNQEECAFQWVQETP